jgi:hypothetical protein
MEAIARSGYLDFDIVYLYPLYAGDVEAFIQRRSVISAG